MQKFCIKDASTMDIVVDNLTPSEAIEVFDLYQEYFGEGSIFMAHNEAPERAPYISRAQEYKNEFIEYFGVLQEMGNLI